MSIALLGIIGLQMNWIMHDIKLKEQQFDQGVTLALNDVVNKIETREVFRIVSDRSVRVSSSPRGISLDKDSFKVDWIAPPAPPEAPLPPEPPPNDRHLAEVTSSRVRINHESRNGQSHTVISIKAGETEYKTIVEDGETPDLSSFSDSISELADKTEEKIFQKMQKLNLVMSKMAVEFGEEGGNIMHRISPQKLDTIIREELSGKGIDIPYNFGIFNRTKDTIIFSKIPGQQRELLQSPHKVMLFPNDLFSKPDYLLVSFPGRMNYVLSSLWLMLAGSAIFTCIILFGFAYTIHVIFRQKKLSDIKTDFINNMTHEFKTPIATISLAVDSIRDPRVYSSPEKINYFTGIIREENKRMNAQVENVLRMAQLEKGELDIKHEEVNVHELIENSVDFIRLQVTRKKGELITRLEARNHLVQGDPFHLANVFNNLLDNANKYSPGNPRITIVTENTSDGILVHVEDNGMGMSAGTQEKIFEKFYRVPTGNIHNIKGFGLGLSYVKAIVEAHKGTVTVKSEVGQGSRFSIFLPFKF